MTKARIEARFAALKAEDRAAFVTYVMAGDPDYATSLEIVKGLPGAGADVIEIGFPFSDPMAEGPPIQRAALRALDKGMTLARTLELVAEFRQGDFWKQTARLCDGCGVPDQVCKCFSGHAADCILPFR